MVGLFSAWKARTFVPATRKLRNSETSKSRKFVAAVSVRGPSAAELKAATAGALLRAISWPLRYAMKPSSNFIRSVKPFRFAGLATVNGTRA